MQIKVVDAGRVEEDRDGFYVDMEEVLICRSVTYYGERHISTYPLRLPNRYSDEVREAIKLDKRIEITFDDAAFGNPVDFVRLL
jgi:hypothetical protein